METYDTLRKEIEALWDDRAGLDAAPGRRTVEEAVELVDKGMLRAARPDADGGWLVNEWVKKAILLYFSIRGMETLEAGPLEFHDKIPLKRNYAGLGVRVVPHAVARHGAYLAPGVVMMPSYVNIGAYVDEGTMVDTWATVGSCAQIGRRVHLSGGVGIGGVLEPLQASPVIVEDDCFVGSRAIIVEGARISAGAVIGANTVITGSTKVIDVTGSESLEYKGYVPPRAIVIPGTYPRKYPAGEYGVPCALIIGRRSEATDTKTSLNDALRDFGVTV